VLQEPRENSTPEWGAAQRSNQSEKNDTKLAKPRSWRGVGAYQSDWGEGNTDKRSPAIFVLDIGTKCITAVSKPEEVSFGQPAWTPDGEYLVFVGWDHKSTIFPLLPEKLGIFACFNRPCQLYALKVSKENIGNPFPIKTSLQSSFSPRFAPDGTLVFLNQDNAVETGVHSATVCLYKSSWETVNSYLNSQDGEMSVTCLVGTGNFSKDRSKFPGLYCSVLPRQCFSERLKSTYVIATTQWRSELAIIAIDLSDGNVVRMSPVSDNASWSLIASKSGTLIEVNAFTAHGRR